MQGPLVVKIGGSLMDRVPDLIPELREFRVLIVPGGGSFADLVRASRVDDQDAAHWMAIAAMEQYGIEVVERVQHAFPSNDHNEFYLTTKKEKSGHLL